MADEKEGNKEGTVQPDKKTLNTTDPQEHMEGPISSLVKKAEDTFEDKGAESSSSKKESSED